MKKKGQGSEQFLTLSYIIPHSPNPATSCLLGPLGDLINFPISNRTPQISNPPPVQPQFFEKWKKKGRFQRTGLPTLPPNRMSLPYPSDCARIDKTVIARGFCLALPCLACTVNTCCTDRDGPTFNFFKGRGRVLYAMPS